MHPFIPLKIYAFSELVERVRLIKIYLVVSTSRDDYVSERRARDDSSKDRESVNDKRSRSGDSRRELIAPTSSYIDCIHCGR